MLSKALTEVALTASYAGHTQAATSNKPVVKYQHSAPQIRSYGFNAQLNLNGGIAMKLNKKTIGLAAKKFTAALTIAAVTSVTP